MVLVAFNTTSAQMINNGTLHISDNGNVYLASSTLTFGTGATTTTTRSANNYGKLQFQSGVTTTGATNTSLLNGYGTAIGATPFTFPIGQSGVYAPAQVAPSATGTINAAYYRGTPSTIDADLDADTVSAISTLEYWNINGTVPAKVKLTWRSDSGLTDIGVANSTANLTIVGYDGIKWVKIASTVDATSLLGGSSTITTGSITSTENIDLNTYQYFALGVEKIDCPPLVTSSGNTKTWDGSWSPSAPTIADPAIINSAYASGSFACNSLTLNANVTLSNGQSLEVNSGVEGSGKIIMSSEASFVQRLGSANAPSIELTKKSNKMRRYDYVYWGTPISGDFFTQISGAIADNASVANAFDIKLKYVSGAGGGWQNLTAIEKGRGFACRVKNQDPFVNGQSVEHINFKFTGTANNGDISVAITRDAAAPNAGRSHVFLANPYPSAIHADKFLKENIDIDGVVYIWQSSTSNSGKGESYNQADYLVYSLAGSVTPGPSSNTFNGYIASGQGFLVKSLVDSGSVEFNNCMRISDKNNGFKKVSNTSKTAIIDRFKLNMTGNNGVFSQILIAYMPEATLGYDRLYDAGRNSVSTAQLYSLFEGDGRKLAINARPSFVDTDEVTLGVSKADTTTETFTITITEKEGIFANGTNVYLFDTDTNEYHNLNEGAFSFDSNSKALNSRFKVVYQNSSLNNPDFDTNTVIASIYKQTLKIKAGLPITNVTIYDITGRLINEIKVNNQLEVSNSFRFAQGIYIAKIKMNNGSVATQKLTNKN
jgi:hypothetical protein